MIAAMRNQGLDEGYVKLIATRYVNSTAKIILDRASRTFTVGRGVKQGDPLSPVLFNALLEDVFREIKRKWMLNKSRK